MLAAAASAQVAALFAGAFDSTLQVDEESGTIKNAAVMTVGPTIGYPFAIDATTLLQARDLINGQAGGVKVRFKHPEIKNGRIADDMGTTVGRLSNARIEGGPAGSPAGPHVLRADVKIGDYAKNLPGYGDARAYLLGIARSDPAAIGLSAVIAWVGEKQGDGTIAARLADLSAVDFVGKAAANPNGLLAAQGTEAGNKKPDSALGADEEEQDAGGADLGREETIVGTRSQGDPMDPKLKKALMGLGLSPDATDEQAQVFYDGLDPEKKKQCDAMCATKLSAEQNAGRNGTQTAQLGAGSGNAGVSQLVALETKRVAEITQLGALLKVGDEIVQQSIAEEHTVEQARTAMLSALKEKWKANPTVMVGRDNNITSLQAAIPEAIMLRADVKVEKPNERADRMRHMSVLMMGRHFLAALGVTDAYELSATHLADMLLIPRSLRQAYPQVAALAQSTGDFANILANTLNKTLRQAYLDAPKTWPIWARRTTAVDFKPVNRILMSEMPSLQRSDDGKGINYVTLGDGKESFALVEYNGGIRLTRRAIINDDLSAFSRAPQMEASACSRLEEDLAYAAITGNPEMSDGVNLFDAAHGNLVSATAEKAAPGVVSLAGAERLMLKQKGPKGVARLEIKPKFLLAPTSLKASTEQFLGSSQLMAVISTTSSAPQTVGTANPYSGKLTPIFSTRLDDVSTTAWYLLADYRDGQIDSIEVMFLADEPEPVLRQETDFDTQDVKYAVRHTVAAKWIDHRSAVRNPGA